MGLYVGMPVSGEVFVIRIVTKTSSTALHKTQLPPAFIVAMCDNNVRIASSPPSPGNNIPRVHITTRVGLILRQLIYYSIPFRGTSESSSTYFNPLMPPLICRQFCIVTKLKLTGARLNHPLFKLWTNIGDRQQSSDLPLCY